MAAFFLVDFGLTRNRVLEGPPGLENRVVTGADPDIDTGLQEDKAQVASMLRNRNKISSRKFH